MKEQNINDTLTTLLDGFKQQDLKLFERISEDIDFSRIKDGETLELYFTHKFNKFISGFIHSKFGGDHNVEFTLRYHRYLESHFLAWIERIEGRSCSADKSRTIMRSLLKFHQTGEDISWNYEGEYTYHLPKKVFNTHEEIISFYESIKTLYYGNPGQYLTHIRKYLIQFIEK